MNTEWKKLTYMRFKREAKQNLNFIEVLSHVKLAHFRCRKIEMVFFRTFQKFQMFFFLASTSLDSKWHYSLVETSGVIFVFLLFVAHNSRCYFFFVSLPKRICFEKMLKCVFFIETENLCFLKINQYLCKDISDHFST